MISSQSLYKYNITLVKPDLDSARKSLRKGIHDNNIDIDVAKTFLYYFGLTIQDTLQDEWRSYGRTIGKTGDIITPISLMDIKENRSLREGAMMEGVKASDDPWMAGYALSIYRLIRATVGDYKIQIAGRVSTQLKAISSTAVEVTEVVDIYKGWINDSSYNSLVASYDMFFTKFPTHKYANLKIGTTGTRYRDCAAIMSYGYITSLLGMSKATELMDWVFVEQIGDDIDRMMSEAEELTEPNSYFPYHVDFGLVVKSAYSASANPHFFHWVHLIGAMMRSPRSMNARQICDSRSADIFANAACLAYVYSTNFTATKVYTADGSELTIKEDLDDTADLDPVQEILRSKDADDWFSLIKTSSGTLPKEVKDHILKIARGIQDPRDGTIDHYLSISAAAFLQ